MPGIEAHNKLPVGTIRIRTRHKRGSEQRAYIKVKEPNEWMLYARYVWESANGTIPSGMAIHHKDRNKLNDRIENLELMSKAKHLEEHRMEFAEKTISGLVSARKKIRWSTKSDTKRTGHPPSWSEEQMDSALTAYFNGEGTCKEISNRFNIPLATLGKYIRVKRQLYTSRI